MSPKEEILILNIFKNFQKYENITENRSANGILRRGEVGQKPPW